MVKINTSSKIQKMREEIEQLEKIELEKKLEKIKQKKKEKVKIPSEETSDLIKPYSPVKSIKDKFLAKYKETSTFLIRMQLRNGLEREMIISTTTKDFKFMGERYLIDEAIRTWVVEAQMYCLSYVQGYTLPIRQSINVSDIKESIEASGLIETELATNPKVLEDFINSKIAEGVMRGQQIDDFLKAVKVWVVVGTCGVIIHLLLFMYKSGMFEQVTSGIGI